VIYFKNAIECHSCFEATEWSAKKKKKIKLKKKKKKTQPHIHSLERQCEEKLTFFLAAELAILELLPSRVLMMQHNFFLTFEPLLVWLSFTHKPKHPN